MEPLTNSQRCFLLAAVFGAVAQIFASTGMILKLVESGDVDSLSRANFGSFSDRTNAPSAREYFR